MFKTNGPSMKKTSKQQNKNNFCKDSCPDFGSSFLKKGAVCLTQNLKSNDNKKKSWETFLNHYRTIRLIRN